MRNQSGRNSMIVRMVRFGSVVEVYSLDLFSEGKRYDLDASYNGKLGTEFFIKRSHRSLALTIYLSGTTLALWKCVHNTEFLALQTCLLLTVVVISTILFYHSLKRVHTESLLIVASLGVTVKRTSMLGTTSQYFDISQIKDIVIIETISMQSVIFQLVLLPKDGPTTDQSTSGKTFPLFWDFKPRLEDLQKIYKEVQLKLFPSPLDVR